MSYFSLTSAAYLNILTQGGNIKDGKRRK